MSRSILKGIVAAVLLIAAGIWILPQFFSADESTAADNSPSAPPATPVRVWKVEAAPFERTIRLTGTLRADESIDIRSEITAKVQEIRFAEGEPVDEGALLVKLDDSELRAQRREVAADLAFARREEERQRDLLRDASTSERIYDEAVNRREMLEARLQSIDERLEKAELRAPFAGVIGLRYVSPGALVQPDTRVASLRRIEPLKIDFAAPERYSNELRPGLPFVISVAGSPNQYTGEVYAREPGIDPHTRTIQLRGRVENPEGRLLPGSYARVDLILGRDEDAILVPAVAVVPGHTPSVFVIDSEGRAQRREVSAGRRTRDRVHILEGLSPGDTVVVAGAQNIRDGQAVRILEDEAAAL